MQRINKLDIADEFLEDAISLYLNEKKYFSALHLAGAAQEIYGKTLRMDKEQNYSDFMLDQVVKIFKKDGIEIDKKAVKKSEMHPKNTIKHINNKKDSFATLNPQLDSCSKILEAIMDHAFLKRKETSCIETFKEYFMKTQDTGML